jgi:calcium-binding protein CML
LVREGLVCGFSALFHSHSANGLLSTFPAWPSPGALFGRLRRPPRASIPPYSLRRIVPLNRILLKFPLLKRTFGVVRKVFSTYDAAHDGHVRYAELGSAMRALGSEMEESEVREVFLAADLYHEGRLSFREFLVCLAIGYLMGKVRGVSEGAAESAKGLKDAEVSASLSAKDGRALAYAFHLALDAYMHFDADASGTISRDEILHSMEPTHAEEGAHTRKKSVGAEAVSFITDDRFQELDFDHDGECTFKEFVHAFANWVGVEDDEDDEDEEEGA